MSSPSPRILTPPSPGRRFLFISASLSLLAARLMVWILPLRVLLNRPGAQKGSRGQFTAEEIDQALQVAGRYIPWGGNCLVQAVAGRALLARHGIQGQIRLGVAKSPGGLFMSHAWVEDASGEILIGRKPGIQFIPLPVWKGGRF